MKIRVKYLLWLRDKAGIDSEEYLFNEEKTLDDLIRDIMKRHPQLLKYMDKIFGKENPIIVLVNGVKRSGDYVLRDGDEIVFIPPVSGG